MDRDEVLAAMRETGLVASSSATSTIGRNRSHPDAAVRQEGIDAMIVAMEDAKAYGTDAVLLVPGIVNEEVSYDDCWNRSTECIKELIPTAEKFGGQNLHRNVWNNFLLSPVEACNYVDQFESPYVKFYFDCGNIPVYGWPEQWIDILDNRIGRIHIKEFSRKEADSKGGSRVRRVVDRGRRELEQSDGSGPQALPGRMALPPSKGTALRRKRWRIFAPGSTGSLLCSLLIESDKPMEKERSPPSCWEPAGAENCTAIMRWSIPNLKIVGIAELVDLRRTMYGDKYSVRSKTGSQRGSRCSTGLNSPMRSLSRRPTTCITNPV